MGTMEDIKNNTYQTKVLLEKLLGTDVRPRNWHKSDTLVTANTEVPFNVEKQLGKQGGRFLRIKVNKQCTLKLELEGIGDSEKWEEGLEPNKALIFKFKSPLTLKKFHITPSASNTTYWLWASTVENPVSVDTEISALDGDTFTSASDRAVLLAGEDGSNIRTISVDGGGRMIVVYKRKRFTAQDLTINDGAIAADGSFKEFDIATDIDEEDIPDSHMMTQISVTQLTFAANMNCTLQIWEKDSSGYNPATRADLYMKIFERDIINTDGEWSEIIEGELYYRDRDGTNELHCRLINNVGGEASDFAVLIKGKVDLDNTSTGDGGASSF